MKRGGSSGKRTPIKGVTGFASSHPCARSLYEGHFIPWLDNFYAGMRGDIPHHRYPHITLAGQVLSLPLDILPDDVLARTVDPLSNQFCERGI